MKYYSYIKTTLFVVSLIISSPRDETIIVDLVMGESMKDSRLLNRISRKLLISSLLQILMSVRLKRKPVTRKITL